ncbi:MAG: hypothetical protein MPW15_01060 [Candidatus Manganitrophus sp.]|nr:hypothetical protein [Candidatus Manganitrophus sp.]
MFGESGVSFGKIFVISEDSMGPIQTTLPEEIVKEIENFGLQVERLKKKGNP